MKICALHQPSWPSWWPGHQNQLEVSVLTGQSMPTMLMAPLEQIQHNTNLLRSICLNGMQCIIMCNVHAPEGSTEAHAAQHAVQHAAACVQPRSGATSPGLKKWYCVTGIRRPPLGAHA